MLACLQIIHSQRSVADYAASVSDKIAVLRLCITRNCNIAIPPEYRLGNDLQIAVFDSLIQRNLSGNVSAFHKRIVFLVNRLSPGVSFDFIPSVLPGIAVGFCIIGKRFFPQLYIFVTPVCTALHLILIQVMFHVFCLCKKASFQFANRYGYFGCAAIVIKIAVFAIVKV